MADLLGGRFVAIHNRNHHPHQRRVGAIQAHGIHHHPELSPCIRWRSRGRAIDTNTAPGCAHPHAPPRSGSPGWAGPPHIDRGIARLQRRPAAAGKAVFGRMRGFAVALGAERRHEQIGARPNQRSNTGSGDRPPSERLACRRPPRLPAPTSRSPASAAVGTRTARQERIPDGRRCRSAHPAKQSGRWPPARRGNSRI